MRNRDSRSPLRPGRNGAATGSIHPRERSGRAAQTHFACGFGTLASVVILIVTSSLTYGAFLPRP